jgi:ADP-ribose pyrophosphatase YjhB (NUDIX family)
MGIAERSRARVEDLLSDLEHLYDSFPVNQRTVALPGERYEEAREAYSERTVDTYVEITNGEGETLHVAEDGSDGLPGAVNDLGESLEAEVARAVAETTGVDFAIDGVSEVTIAGISNADEPDEPVLYRLLVVFSATYEGGEPASDAEWRGASPEPMPTYV